MCVGYCQDMHTRLCQGYVKCNINVKFSFRFNYNSMMVNDSTEGAKLLNTALVTQIQLHFIHTNRFISRQPLIYLL